MKTKFIEQSKDPNPQFCLIVYVQFIFPWTQFILLESSFITVYMNILKKNTGNNSTFFLMITSLVEYIN